MLGLWHLVGEQGLVQDHVKAVAWFRKAAGLGYAQGQRELALCYLEGKGVEQSCALSVECGQKAADQGDAAAQWFVGESYALGAVGVKKDLPLGKRYQALSAAHGAVLAVTLLEKLRKCVAGSSTCTT